MALSLPCVRAIQARGGSVWWLALLGVAHVAGLTLAQAVIRRQVQSDAPSYPMVSRDDSSAQALWALGQRRRRALSSVCGAAVLAMLFFEPALQRPAALWVGRAVRWLAERAQASSFSAAVLLLALCGLLFGWRAGLREIREIEGLLQRQRQA